MLQLLQPSWLYALTGISIPVIIHLWNQRPGRILKVGSTSLIPEEAKEYKRSLKLSDLLLLLLRCLLIAALAIALSNPFLKKINNSANQKGWILMSKENLHETYTHFKPVIDSLYNAGLEFHYFTESFAREKIETALAIQNDTFTGKPVSYWKLAESLDATLTAPIPLYIFTDNYLEHFHGNRPVLSYQPKWYSYTPSTISTQFENTTTKNDTAAINISIFTDKYDNDARYIKAALEAIKSFSKRNIQAKIINDYKQIPAKQDWVFWLSDQPVNLNIGANNVFYYAAGKLKNISSVINPGDNTIAIPLLLYKSIEIEEKPEDNAEQTWSDGFGNTVLSHTKSNDRDYYRFYSHFDPSWNELTWNNNFPAIIYSLLQRKKNTDTIADDNRLIDQKQLLPAYQPNLNEKGKESSSSTIELSGYFWILVLVLFFAERLFSFYNNKLKTNG